MRLDPPMAVALSLAGALGKSAVRRDGRPRLDPRSRTQRISESAVAVMSVNDNLDSHIQ
jgi:hypothetical protein